MKKEIRILAESSGRHIHLCEADLKALYGPDAELEPKRLLGDGGGGFTCQYKVKVEGTDGKSCPCTIIGPLRKETQLEFSYTEARAIGLTPPLGDSGVLEGTASVRIRGDHGALALKRGLFVPRRHVHLTVQDAEELEIRNGDRVRIRVAGPRAMVFDEVIANIPPPHVPMSISAFHVDYDEWNAAALFLDPFVYVSKKQSKGD